MIGLAPGVTTTFSGSVLMPRTSRLLRAMASRNSGNPAVGAVVGEPVADGRHPRFDDVARRVKVGFADFQVDDLPALGLKGAGLGQHLESALGPQVMHSGGDSSLFPPESCSESPLPVSRGLLHYFPSPLRERVGVRVNYWANLCYEYGSCTATPAGPGSGCERAGRKSR